MYYIISLKWIHYSLIIRKMKKYYFLKKKLIMCLYRWEMFYHIVMTLEECCTFKAYLYLLYFYLRTRKVIWKVKYLLTNRSLLEIFIPLIFSSVSHFFNFQRYFRSDHIFQYFFNSMDLFKYFLVRNICVYYGCFMF